MYKFLVAEDSKVILRDIVHLINEAGYDSVIKTAYDGEAAAELLKDFEPDIIFTDIKMPVIDGLTLIQKAKALYPGVKSVIISGYADFTLTHEALMLQVDDYIMKPFDSKEMVARVRAVLRRYQPVKPEAPAAEKVKCVEYDGLTINLTNYSVLCDGQNVDMPPKELELLYFLAASPNQVFTREQLLDQIWGYEYIGDTRTVDVHIKRLREKIKDHSGWGLSTVWGIGYKFEVK